MRGLLPPNLARTRIGLACILSVLASACTTLPSATPPRDGPQAKPARPAPPQGKVLARNERFVVYAPAPKDSLASLAASFLGDERLGWMIADFNRIKTLRTGMAVAIPLHPPMPQGVRVDGYQTVPILTYHRFGPKAAKMVVTPEDFAAQMDFLAEHGYRVIPLSDLVEFLKGRQALPERSVVITIDDGYASNYHHAYPVLKKHGFPATIFLYTDFAGAGDALSWAQMKEMRASGLIDIQAHSKSHANLTDRLAGESEEAYRQRLDSEIQIPRDTLKRRLGADSLAFAYPYGDANTLAIDRVSKAGYDLAATVEPGGNPFFAHPYLLHRSMVFGDQGLADFKARLQVFVPLDLR